MVYTLPKIWLGRIQKYWDKIMPSPSSYPNSNSIFSLKFDSAETKKVVDKFEAELGTEESVVLELLPENTFVSSYIGTYNVDGVPGELTLLSPEPVNSNLVIALHYNEETAAWENIEDIEIKNGFVWGTLDSFSPIAILTYGKDIHKDEITGVPGLADGTYVICEGNPVSITEDEETENIIIKNLNNETEIVLDSGVNIIYGGSIDGTPIDSTSITIKNVKNTKKYIKKILGGSFFYDAEDETNTACTTVKSVNIKVFDSDLPNLTGSSSAVRTDSVNYQIVNSKINWIGSGESYNTPLHKDMNKPECDFSSRAWVKNVNYEINNSEIELLYLGGNTGYFYVDNTNAVINKGSYDYLIHSGSNGKTKDSTIELIGSNVKVFQTVNRGYIDNCVAKFKNDTIEKLFIGGDATDDTVTGTTKSIKMDISIGDGSYNIMNGFEGGALMTEEQLQTIVDTIKVSRNTTYTIEDELKAMLGSKFVVK